MASINSEIFENNIIEHGQSLLQNYIEIICKWVYDYGIDISLKTVKVFHKLLPYVSEYLKCQLLIIIIFY